MQYLRFIYKWIEVPEEDYFKKEGTLLEILERSYISL